MNQVREDVYRIVSTVFSVEPTQLDPSAPWESLGADSFDLVEFIIALDQHFSIDGKLVELTRLQSIDDVVHFVESRARGASR